MMNVCSSTSAVLDGLGYGEMNSFTNMRASADPPCGRCIFMFSLSR